MEQFGFDILFYSFLLAEFLLFILGVLGAIVPMIPGTFIAFAGVLLAKFYYPVELSWLVVWIALAIAVLSQLADFLFTWLGAKKFGATWKGTLGAFLVVILGILIPPQIVMIFLLPFILAFAFEAIGGSDLKSSLKAGTGAFLGGIAAMIIKIVAVVIIYAWTISEILRNIEKLG